MIENEVQFVIDDLSTARAIHVCRTASRSGIADYARDFHAEVLEPLGYVLADPDTVIAALPRLRRDVRIHIQFGVFQQAERRAMSRLLRAGVRHVDGTLHDPPFLSFPYFDFELRVATQASRGFDWYMNSFGIQRRAIEALERVFVLSHAGEAAVRRLAPRARTVVIPHIVRPEAVWAPIAEPTARLLFFGFIGPGKGLDYALEIHSRLLAHTPGLRLDVVGGVNGAAVERYVAGLRARYTRGVTFHGYLPETVLDTLFSETTHVLLPYASSRYICPASGSVIQALRRARIVWTTPTEAMSEVIRDDDNGFMLSMDFARDAERLATVNAQPARIREVSVAARAGALAMASYPYKSHFAFDAKGST